MYRARRLCARRAHNSKMQLIQITQHRFPDSWIHYILLIRVELAPTCEHFNIHTHSSDRDSSNIIQRPSLARDCFELTIRDIIARRAFSLFRPLSLSLSLTRTNKRFVNSRSPLFLTEQLQRAREVESEKKRRERERRVESEREGEREGRESPRARIKGEPGGGGRGRGRRPGDEKNVSLSSESVRARARERWSLG